MLRGRQQRLPELDKPCRQPAAPAKRIMPAVNLTPENRLLCRSELRQQRLVGAKNNRFTLARFQPDAQPGRGHLTLAKLFADKAHPAAITVRPPVGA